MYTLPQITLLYCTYSVYTLDKGIIRTPGETTQDFIILLSEQFKTYYLWRRKMEAR